MLYSDQIAQVKKGGNWAKQYQERIKRSKAPQQQQQQQEQQAQRQSIQRESRKQYHSKDEESERQLSTQKSNQRIPTEDSRERKETKTVRVKTETDVERHNQWDDIPVGGKSKKKNEGLMTWDNAYPPDSQLDNNQVEFLQNQKQNGKNKKNAINIQEEEGEYHTINQSERKNQWDEIPIGGQKKKAMEQNWDEYPTNTKPITKPVKKVVKKVQNNEEEGTAESAQKPQAKKNVKRTKEQLENLKKRTKYDPRKAIEQAKQKQGDEDVQQQSPQKEVAEESNPQNQEHQHEQLHENTEQTFQQKKRQIANKKPIKKVAKNNQDEDEDFHVPNEDESQIQIKQDYSPVVKKSPKNVAVKRGVQPKKPQNNNEGQVFKVEELNQDGDNDDNKQRKEFLKKKPKDIKFQKLNWNNVKSRTDTGRQELESREQYKKQQKVAQQQIQERQNQMKKNQKKQNQILPYYSELNYIDEDEAFNEPIKKNNQLNISNSRNPNAYFDHNHQKQVTQQQYPVAPKVFTEYLPHKVQQKAIHQASPTQPSQEIIIRPQMFQNKNMNNNNDMDNVHYVDGNSNQNMLSREQQLLEIQKNLQGQQQSSKYINAVSDLERMRQNKRESILSQQQQQQQQYQQPQQQAQQFMQDYQRISNNQYSEEQLRELQMRQFQQSQSQHKQIFQFPQNFFKGENRGIQQNNQAMRYEDYIQSQQNQQNGKSIQEIMLKKQQQFMKLDEFS